MNDNERRIRELERELQYMRMREYDRGGDFDIGKVLLWGLAIAGSVLLVMMVVGLCTISQGTTVTF